MTNKDVLAIKRAIELLSDPSRHSVTVFRDEKFRVRVTRIRKAKDEFRVTMGKPNYAEKEYVKFCKRAKAWKASHPPIRFWLFPEKRKAA
jgi:hypothetical protein